MNVLDEHKIILLLPPRQGARAIFKIFHSLGAKSQSPRPGVASHQLKIPTDKTDYSIISTIRHPYLRFKSIMNWTPSPLTSYEEGFKDNFPLLQDNNKILNIHKQHPIKHFIDTDNMLEDILKIPLIQEYKDSNLQLQDTLEHFANINGFKSKNKPFVSSLIPQKIKDKIYDMMPQYFEMFNYDKNLNV
jgi:hypothetical protein